MLVFTGDQNLTYGTFSNAQITLTFTYGDRVVTAETNQQGKNLKITSDVSFNTYGTPNANTLEHPENKSLSNVRLVCSQDIVLANGTTHPAGTPLDHAMRLGSVTVHYID